MINLFALFVVLFLVKSGECGCVCIGCLERTGSSCFWGFCVPKFGWNGCCWEACISDDDDDRGECKVTLNDFMDDLLVGLRCNMAVTDEFVMLDKLQGLARKMDEDLGQSGEKSIYNVLGGMWQDEVDEARGVKCEDYDHSKTMSMVDEFTDCAGIKNKNLIGDTLFGAKKRRRRRQRHHR